MTDLTQARLTEASLMRGLEAGSNRVLESYVPSGALPSTWADNFNRADGTIIGADYAVWSQYGFLPPSYPGIGIVGNVVKPDPNFQGIFAIRSSSEVLGNRQRVKVTYNSPAEQFALGLFQTSVPLAQDGLFALWIGDGEVYWYFNGSFAGASSGTNPSGTHTHELRYDGTTAEWLVDGVVFASTAAISITYAGGRTHQGFGFNNVNPPTYIDDADGGVW